ncbi:MAG: hypothetical protein HC799_16655 [Limnothrix sp. RL_2_0]|nr:hypothetical protein [Limnothrix sp. RL_2_0]
MAMPSTGPYKSKLFNFLNRQSIQWNSRLVQTARRLKITVEWGTQIAAYPLYLLVQTSRVASRQIAASVAKKQSQQQAIAATSDNKPPTDITTEILTLNSSEAQPQALQGIACDLVTQDILFVDIQNETVQPDQSQASLQKQISLHLAEINYQKRQQELAAIPPVPPRILPPVQPQKPKIIAPVRWLLQGISWLEQSPVAIAIDLFGESTWRTAVIPPEIYAPKLLPPLPLEPILNPLDQKVAALEQKLLTPKLSELPAIQRLFQQALQRFSPPNPPASTVPAATTPPTSPWLKWTDLFLDKLPLQTPQTTAADAQETPAPSPTPLPLPAVAESLITNTLQQPANIVARRSPKSEAITPFMPEPSGDLVAKLVPEEETQTHDLATVTTDPPPAIEAQPPWIETKALSTGYDQHFLERILKGIDQFMAWVENTFSKIWSKLRG